MSLGHKNPLHHFKSDAEGGDDMSQGPTSSRAADKIHAVGDLPVLRNQISLKLYFHLSVESGSLFSLPSTCRCSGFS
jgi:hypothetical protein